MTEQQALRIAQVIRTLGTLAGLVIAAIGICVWRISAVMLSIYRDFGMPETWREPTLTWLSSPYILVAILMISAVLIAATWRLSISASVSLVVTTVILTWILLIGATWFYTSILSYPATSMSATSP